MSVPAEDFVKENYRDLISGFVESVSAGKGGKEFIQSGSNLEVLIGMWAEEGETSAALGYQSPLEIFSNILKEEAEDTCETGTHASGARTCIFDTANNYYYTVVEEGGKLLLSGIGSAFGGYVTKKYEAQMSYKVTLKNYIDDVVNGGDGRNFIRPDSNMSMLLDAWAGEGEAAASAGYSSPPLILATAFQTMVLDSLAPISVTTLDNGDKKLVFDEEQNFYFTITPDEDAQLTGIGSALGRYVTEMYEGQFI
eukprot:CAMPEP_0174262422 /NCGR_PEP_ID=MMETSP0439-20130205/12965_1 /TAXON_ID=0 /ORGANISM="Stereomyxa ramosa, Strain Chinc5" /LENGTH=252 /DNA_ID=CAMNT_0015347127 /DNA_START=14 /DNA_END=772 /DNA_ORIENTATION=-